MKSWLFTIVWFCCCSSVGWAASTHTITPELNLLTVNAIKTLEVQGDELYLDVTVFSSTASGQSHTYQVPEQPQYWSSNQLDDV
nr:hypothetical protein [Legionellales bacterium]